MAVGTVLAIGSLLANAGVNAYNIWQQKRENRITREREDNAVSRRVADLEGNGLSPTLAAGSAASAQGLQAPQSEEIPTWYDVELKKNMLDQIQAETRRANAEAKSTEMMADNTTMDRNLKRLSYLYSLGLSPSGFHFDNTGKAHDVFFWNDMPSGDWTYNDDLVNSPYLQMYRANMNNVLNQSDMVAKSNAWFNFNQGLNAVGEIGDLALDGIGLFQKGSQFNKNYDLDVNRLRKETFDRSKITRYDNKGRIKGYDVYQRDGGFRFVK